MSPSEQLPPVLTDKVRQEIERIVEEESKAAAANTERRVRARLGQICTEVMQSTTFERHGSEIRITVHFPS